MVLGYAVEFLQRLYENQLSLNSDKKTSEVLSRLKSKFEIELNSVIYLANGLTTFIAVTPNSTHAEWERMSAELIRNGRHIRNIGVAPDLVIRFVYPVEGNEKAIGLRFEDTPTQWESVKLAIDMQQTVIAGPLELVQGGTALIVRAPIFLDAPQNTQLWGITSVVIDVESLIAAIKLDKLSLDYQISIRRRDIDDTLGSFLYGNEDDFISASAIEEVLFPTGSLVITAAEKASAQSSWLVVNSVRIVGALIIGLLLVIFSVLMKLYRMSLRDSLHDPLTGLANRRLVKDRFNQHIHFHNRKKQSFSVIVIDLNDFKPINDQYGHHAGDEILKQVADRLKAAIRASDTVARIGGDEFLLLLPECSSLAQKTEFIEKIRQEIVSRSYTFKNHQIDVGASLGWSTYPEDGDDFNFLVNKADARMYDEKSARRR